MQSIEALDWNTYAQKYYMLLAYNPFYQQLHREVMEEVKPWEVGANDLLADIGAGTGNYSLAIARQFPQAVVMHVDKDEGMNAQAEKKKNREGLDNLQVLSMGVDEIQWRPESLRGLVSIHALYTFSNPTKVLRDMYGWLKPGGYALLVNAGRVVRILDWQLAVGWQLLRKYGLKKTLEIMNEGKEVSRQNAFIRDMQRKGVFWTHSHEAFCQAVQEAGFEIVKSKTCFRGVSDFVTARKS